MAGGQRGGDGHDERHRQPERMGARNHHHGHAPFQSKGNGLSQCKPHQEGRQAGRQGKDRQPESGSVRQILRPRTGLLSLPHQFNDLSQIRIAPRLLDLDDDRAFSVDRASDDTVSF